MSLQEHPLTGEKQRAGEIGAPGSPAAWQAQRTLAGPEYSDPQVWELEKDRIFFTQWFCVGRSEQVAAPGDYSVVDVAGESIILTRNKTGEVRAHYNTCAHRGTRLCDGSGSLKSAVIKCPYHAWTFDADGVLLGTPNVREDEGFDRSLYPLRSVHVDEFEGWVFVNLSDADPVLLADWIANDPNEPRAYSRWGQGDLRVGHVRSYDVGANWKIVVDNYNECLHCPSVHPELVQVVPVYKKGVILERDGWDGVSLGEGMSTFSMTGVSGLPRLPGLSDEDAHAYFGYTLFPNLLMNFLSDVVFGLRLVPRGPELTTVVTEFLFQPETIADPNFDHSPVTDFVDLVSRQDWEVCERAQVGNRSRGYRDGGVYPYNDRLVHYFNEHYRSFMRD